MVVTQQQSVELRIPCDAKYIVVARLVVGGVGARVGLSMDDIDDLKVAVSEACTHVIQHAFADSDTPEEPAVIALRFIPREKALQIEVEDYGAGFDADQIQAPNLSEPSMDQGLGLYLIGQMTDQVEVQSAPGSGTKVIMTKHVAR